MRKESVKYTWHMCIACWLWLQISCEVWSILLGDCFISSSSHPSRSTQRRIRRKDKPFLHQKNMNIFCKHGSISLLYLFSQHPTKAKTAVELIQYVLCLLSAVTALNFFQWSTYFCASILCWRQFFPPSYSSCLGCHWHWYECWKCWYYLSQVLEKFCQGEARCALLVSEVRVTRPLIGPDRSSDLILASYWL